MSRGESDIDIAVVCDPFHSSRLDEAVDIHRASVEIDPRVETVTLRREDLNCLFFALGRELAKSGLEV
jgi:hypothetical protein